ncbi:magnesium transporter CorA-like family protein [Actinidia rufa]|uniref:Magnesium transporter CorA-like family protein n=1 Tax=Actinidia rufa TaxID=165716 RepID=A0A7J0DKU3_9ERIC|nr:magnesium transporter CorA-like family protein [Actinidia rufa]
MRKDHCSNGGKTKEENHKGHLIKEAMPGTELWADGLIYAFEYVGVHRKSTRPSSYSKIHSAYKLDGENMKKQVPTYGVTEAASSNVNRNNIKESTSLIESGSHCIAPSDDTDRQLSHSDNLHTMERVAECHWVPIGWARISELVQTVQVDTCWDSQQFGIMDDEDDLSAADLAAPYWERPGGPRWWCHVSAGHPFVDAWLRNAQWLHPAVSIALRDESRLISDRMKHLLYEVPVRVAGGLLFELLGQSAGDPFVDEDDIPIVLRSWQAQNFLITALHVKGPVSGINVLGITEVQEQLFAGGYNSPRSVHEVIALLASRLARWDDSLLGLWWSLDLRESLEVEEDAYHPKVLDLEGRIMGWQVVVAKGRCPSQVSNIGGHIKGQHMVVVKVCCYCDVGSKWSGLYGQHPLCLKTHQGGANPKVGLAECTLTILNSSLQATYPPVGPKWSPEPCLKPRPYELFRKFIFGEADEVELKFVNRRNYEDMKLFSIILNQEIRRLSRQVIRVKWSLHAREEIVFELLQHLRGNTTKSLLEEIRKSTREMIEEQEAVRGRLFTIQDVMQSTVRAWLQDRSLRVTHNLAVFGGCGLVLSIITGLFGINVGGIPGSEAPYAFGVFAAILFVLGIVLIVSGLLYLGLKRPITEEQVQVRKLELQEVVKMFQHEAESHAQVRKNFSRNNLPPTNADKFLHDADYILIH